MGREPSPLGDSNSESNQEIFYEEVQRQIDYQIEANRWLENQAGRLLRILIALIGILLSVAGRFVINIYNTESNFTLVNVNQSASILVDQYDSIGVAEASLIVALLGISGTVFLYMSAMKLFYETPKYTMEIIWSSPINAGINIGTTTNKIEEDYYFRNTKKGLVDQYITKIKENQQILERTRENWEKCHQSIRAGILYFLLMAGALVPLAVFTDAFLMVFNFLIILAYFGNKILTYVSWSTLRAYLVRNKYSDSSLIILTICYYVFALTPSENLSVFWSLLVSTFFLVGIVLLIFIPYKETTDTATKLLARNGISTLFFILLLFLLTSDKSATITGIANADFFVRIIYSLAGSTFIISLSLIIILFFWNLYFAGRSAYRYLPLEKIPETLRRNTND